MPPLADTATRVRRAVHVSGTVEGNCTLCGPRFTIVRSVPHDRQSTTMASFALCPECRRAGWPLARLARSPTAFRSVSVVAGTMSAALGASWAWIAAQRLWQ